VLDEHDPLKSSTSTWTGFLDQPQSVSRDCVRGVVEDGNHTALGDCCCALWVAAGGHIDTRVELPHVWPNVGHFAKRLRHVGVRY
jgi:hypothetical protein